MPSLPPLPQAASSLPLHAPFPCCSPPVQEQSEISDGLFLHVFSSPRSAHVKAASNSDRGARPFVLTVHRDVTGSMTNGR